MVTMQTDAQGKGFEVHALEEALVARWLTTPTASAVAALREELVGELSRKRRPL